LNDELGISREEAESMMWAMLDIKADVRRIRELLEEEDGEETEAEP
jgi:hypothetical protein